MSSDHNEANPTLQPERITSYELEVDQSLGKQLPFTASGYLNRMDELITPDLNAVTGNVEFTSADALRTKGLEFAFAGKTRGGFQGGLLRDPKFKRSLRWHSLDANGVFFVSRRKDDAERRVGAPSCFRA